MHLISPYCAVPHHRGRGPRRRAQGGDDQVSNLLLRLIAPYCALMHRTAPSGARSSPPCLRSAMINFYNLLLRFIAHYFALLHRTAPSGARSSPPCSRWRRSSFIIGYCALLHLISPYCTVPHHRGRGPRRIICCCALLHLTPHCACCTLLHLIAPYRTIGGEVLAAVLQDGQLLRYCGAAQWRAAVRPFLLGAIARCVQAQRRAVVASAIAIRNTRDFIVR